MGEESRTGEAPAGAETGSGGGGGGEVASDIGGVGEGDSNRHDYELEEELVEVGVNRAVVEQRR